MGKFIDLTGRKFGQLTVVSRAENLRSASGRPRVMWNCTCTCGNNTTVTSDALLSGNQISCGCYRKKHAVEMFTKHGKTDSRLYYVWSGLKARCYNKNVYEYRFYGARGIRVCDEWRNDFSAFEKWMLDNGYDECAPRGQYTIDRIDCNGNYSPENCRIITQQKQMSNLRSNHLLEYNGETHTLAEWGRITGISPFKIRNRIARLGWTAERALTTS